MRIRRIDVTNGGRDIKYDTAISKKAARQVRLERSTSLSSSFNSSVSVAAPAEEPGLIWKRSQAAFIAAAKNRKEVGNEESGKTKAFQLVIDYIGKQ